jgi:hypothetical protein
MRRFLLALTMTSLMNAQTLPEQIDRYFEDVYFKYRPSDGTQAGFHQYDRVLEEYSKASIDEQIAALHKAEKTFSTLAVKGSTEEADRDLVLGDIRARLLDFEQVRWWEKNPDRYSSGVSSSIFTLISRNFASPEERLKSVIARERQMPAVFEAARANLKNPPRIYTEIAIEQLPGIISFFQNDVPMAFTKVTDQALLADFKRMNTLVLDSLKQYESFLNKELLPLSKGDFRLGAEVFSKKLSYEEMVEIPLDRLLEIGMQNLRDNQKAFKEVGAKLDPKKTPLQILDEINKEHPAPDKLLQTFRDTLGGLSDFIQSKHIVTIPSPVRPLLEETPPFLRALTFASMDTPGPYEKVAKEAFFNVTLPEKGWSAKRTEEHMSGFNRGTIISTAIHEAYPGHYVQFLWMQNVQSKVRKLLGASSNAEGWAHYSEQMMLDEGYGAGDLKLRLGQLQDALLRNARFIVGIQMHTGKMTMEQGIDFFVKEGYASRANGERETKRGTSDPTYLYYTLGKLEILKLREDYKKMKGKDFSLEEFHNRFMKEGFPPIKIVRRALLGNDSPVL